MRYGKKLLALILGFVLLLGGAMTTSAQEAQASVTVKGLSGTTTEIRLYKMIGLDDTQNNWVVEQWAKNYVKVDEKGQYSYDLSQVSVPAQPTDSKTTSETQVTFSGLDMGAYLITVVDTTGVTTYNNGVATTYEYNEESGLIQPKQAEIFAKSFGSKTEKTQTEEAGVADDAVVEVGSVISYEISTVIPYFDGEDDTFWISDTLTGATYNNDAVAMIGNQVVFDKDSLKTDATKTESETFRYDMSSLLEGNQYAGQTLRLVYTATVLGADQVTNVASASNNPQGNMPTTVVYTGKATITKYGEDKEKLSGAKFILFCEREAKIQYAVIENGYLKSWTTDKKKASQVTTDKNGVAVIKGLNVGSYYVEETQAPKGYSVANPESFKGNFYAGKIEIEKLVKDKEVLVEGKTSVTDSKLMVLPSTGGMGTTIFFIGGATLACIGAGGYLVFKKKNEKVA